MNVAQNLGDCKTPAELAKKLVLSYRDGSEEAVEIEVDDLAKYEKMCGTVGDKMFKLEHIDFLKKHGVEKVYLAICVEDGEVCNMIAQLNAHDAEQFGALAGLREDTTGGQEGHLGPEWSFFESE